jgi:hypothetical protein
VTDTQTKKGLSGLRVEVWNSPAAQHAVLGSAVTDAQGQFDIASVADVPQEPAGGSTGVVPATLRVFQGTQSLAISGQADIPDLFKFKGPAVLQVHPDQPQTELKDHVTVEQVLQGLDFLRQSDFKGLFSEGRTRARSVGSLVTASLTAAARKFVLKPVKPSQVRNSDVVNQDSNTAKRRLDQQQIKVASVQQYQPGLGTLGDVTSVGATLKPGDTVDLFEENGIVKSYRIQRAPKTGDTTKLATDVTSLQGDVHNLQTRTQEIDELKLSQLQQTDTITALQQKAAMVDQLQAQLAKVQSDSAAKDQTITKLQSDVATVSKAHADLAAKVSPERLAAIEESVKKLQRPG